MVDVRWKQRFSNYDKALKQLEDAVDLYNNRTLTAIETQGLIKAFELTLELSWNVLKDYLEQAGITEIFESKNTFRQAFKNGLLENGQEWIDMVEDRNLSAHTYNEDIAMQLAKNIAQKYLCEFRNLRFTPKKIAEQE